MFRSLAHITIEPLLQVWLLVGLGAFFRWKKSKSFSKTIFFTALVWMFLISVSPLPTWLARQWEKPFIEPLLRVQAFSPHHIVVLGGGHTHDPSLPANGQLSAQALGRLAESIRLYLQHPGSQLVLSGYGSPPGPAQAELLAEAAVALGVSPADTLINPLPVNTEAEAFTLAQRLPLVDSIILVTNALHMRRAMFWFRQAGFHPIPAPTNLAVKSEPDGSPYDFWPSTQKITLTKKLFHEWVGMLYAHWKS